MNIRGTTTHYKYPFQTRGLEILFHETTFLEVLCHPFFNINFKPLFQKSILSGAEGHHDRSRALTMTNLAADLRQCVPTQMCKCKQICQHHMHFTSQFELMCPNCKTHISCIKIKQNDLILVPNRKCLSLILMNTLPKLDKKGNQKFYKWLCIPTLYLIWPRFSLLSDDLKSLPTKISTLLQQYGLH